MCVVESAKTSLKLNDLLGLIISSINLSPAKKNVIDVSLFDSILECST